VNFGEALNELLAGNTVTRKSWNGKGMYLMFVPSNEWAVSSGLLREHLQQQAWIAMRTADAKLVPWLASQADLLSDDWECESPAKPATQTLAPSGFHSEVVHNVQ
jgi:hypothetical protein